MAKNTNKKQKREKEQFFIHKKKLPQVFTQVIVSSQEKSYSDFFVQLHEACFIKYPSCKYCGDAYNVSSALLKHQFSQIERKALNRIFHVMKRAKVLIAPEGFKPTNGDGQLEYPSNDRNEIFFNIAFNLAKYRYRWINVPEDWKVELTKIKEDKMFSLIKFLTIRYDVPRCFFSVWKEAYFNNSMYGSQFDCFFNVGNGESIKKQKKLPIDLTKKSTHMLFEVPYKYGFTQGFRWAQLRGMGINQRTIEGVMNTPLMNCFEDKSREEFWMSVIRFFHDNPLLEIGYYRTAYDFLNEKKFASRRAIVNGVFVVLPPEQPNLSMKNRNPFTLMEEILEWNERISNRSQVDETVAWSSTGLCPFEYKYKSDMFEIVELTSYLELKEEGREMKHCVASYAFQCQQGKSAIFSLRKICKDSIERMATFQLDISRKEVVQFRKKCNLSPTPFDKTIVHIWANRFDLKVSHCI